MSWVQSVRRVTCLWFHWQLRGWNRVFADGSRRVWRGNGSVCHQPFLLPSGAIWNRHPGMKREELTDKSLRNVYSWMEPSYAALCRAAPPKMLLILETSVFCFCHSSPVCLIRALRERVKQRKTRHGIVSGVFTPPVEARQFRGGCKQLERLWSSCLIPNRIKCINFCDQSNQRGEAASTKIYTVFPLFDHSLLLKTSFCISAVFLLYIYSPAVYLEMWRTYKDCCFHTRSAPFKCYRYPPCYRSGVLLLWERRKLSQSFVYGVCLWCCFHQHLGNFCLWNTSLKLLDNSCFYAGTCSWFFGVRVLLESSETNLHRVWWHVKLCYSKDQRIETSDGA